MASWVMDDAGVEPMDFRPWKPSGAPRDNGRMHADQQCASRGERYALAVVVVFAVVTFVLVHDIEAGDHHGAVNVATAQAKAAPHIDTLCALMVVAGTVLAMRARHTSVVERVPETPAPRFARQSGCRADRPPPRPGMDSFRPMLA